MVSGDGLRLFGLKELRRMGVPRYAVGIDLGGTAVKYALVASDGDVLFSGKLPSRAAEGAAAVGQQIVVAARSCCDEAARGGLHLAGVGIGTPGVVSPEGIVVGGAENIPGWENVNLAKLLGDVTGLPVRVENDANLMALAETLYGAARGASDVVFLTIGTGIGGGVLIGGRLFGGFRNRGTELGHITLKCDGEPCACGSVGCFEHYASTAALVRRYRERCLAAGIVPAAQDGEMLVGLYHAGDLMAVAALEEHWEFMSLGVASLINIFAPQRVVIGGGISEAGEFYFAALRERVARRVIPVCGGTTQIVAATLGNRAGCLGAAGLIFDL